MPPGSRIPISPADALSRWPAHSPLVAWWSASPDRPRFVLSTPASISYDQYPQPLAPIMPRSSPSTAGGWIGLLSYDLGRVLEPRAGLGAALDDRRWPSAAWFRLGDGWFFEDQGPPTRLGAGVTLDPAPADPTFHAESLLTTPREEYLARVKRVIEYIRAGDAYQVNLAHRLSAPFEGSARGLFLALATSAQPWHGCYAEWDMGPRRFAAASASPELLLHVHARTGEAVARPMKGTRPAGAGREADLAASPKDRAELAMIVDLMRNDLGRVCDLGSVRVRTPRRIETHARGDAAILQATAEVHGSLRAGLTGPDLLRAVFPGGSVTGAPKIRAMQIIDELEPVQRGLYCGSCAMLEDDGTLTMNVAIRTAMLQGEPDPAGRGILARGTLDYSVGAGIVADSDPAAEWDETLAKAGVLRAALRAGAVAASRESPA
jgi:para-aminobenzoate synthetase component I